MSYDFKFPDIGEGIVEGEIIKWLVKVGDKVKEDQALAKIETEKAVAEMPCPKDGIVEKIHFKEGDTVKVGDVLITINEKTKKDGKKKEKVNSKKLAKKDKGGVVGKFEEAEEGENVFERAKKKVKTKNLESSKVEKKQIIVKKKYDLYGYVDRIHLKGIRKSVAKKMALAVSNAALLTHMDEADITNLVELREKEKVEAKKKKIHLTFLPYIVKATVSSMKNHPIINSELNEDDQEIVVKKYYNFGIAVTTDDGLVVPVIKGVDQKDIFTVAKEISMYAGQVRNKKINLGDLKGGTFTITNYGSIGGLFATPIPNFPEVSILGVGRIYKKVLLIEDKMKIRFMLPLSFSWDHRVFDGAKAAEFMNDLIGFLENPKKIK